MNERPEILTLGHSNHSLDRFISLLRQHRVTAVADVRSTPYSRRSPQFNRESLKEALQRCHIAYSFLGAELGGRPADASCYDAEGRVRYEVVRRTARFRQGVERVMGGAMHYRVAVMCSEHDPTECHRTILVAPALQGEGATVQNILRDGALEPYHRSIERLAEARRLPRFLFGEAMRHEEALTRAGRRVAFRDPALGEAGTQG